MKKTYIIDTNVLIDSPKSIEVLRNGNENEIYIPHVVIEEIDKHKSKTMRLKPQIREVIDELEIHCDHIHFFGKPYTPNQNPDDIIICSIKNDPNLMENGILVSKDKLFKIKARNAGIKVQDYKSSNPFKTESEKYTGFVDPFTEEYVENCFFYNEGKLFQYKNGKKLIKEYDQTLWKLKPLTKWQNACMMLLSDDTIPLMSIQSHAGTGKTMLSLAAALTAVLEKKTHSKILIIKPNIEIGNELGYLPGSIQDKMDPYFKPIMKLLTKLHTVRQANKIFDQNNDKWSLNEDIIEMIPINFLRGCDIEDTFVVFDEVQNTERIELKTVLSRMGKNVKCVCTGDVNQLDNKHCDKNSNGLNWIIKKFKGEKEYAHIVLGGNHSRGPIADMVIRRGL